MNTKIKLFLQNNSSIIFCMITVMMQTNVIIQGILQTNMLTLCCMIGLMIVNTISYNFWYIPSSKK